MFVLNSVVPFVRHFASVLSYVVFVGEQVVAITGSLNSFGETFRVVTCVMQCLCSVGLGTTVPFRRVFVTPNDPAVVASAISWLTVLGVVRVAMSRCGSLGRIRLRRTLLSISIRLWLW